MDCITTPAHLDGQHHRSQALLVLVREGGVELWPEPGRQPGQEEDEAVPGDHVEEVVAEVVRQVPDHRPLHVSQSLLLQKYVDHNTSLQSKGSHFVLTFGLKAEKFDDFLF